MISDPLRHAAAIMLRQLQSEKLTVVLIPSERPEIAARGGKIRAVESQNPVWYRDFCAAYEAQRDKPRQRRKCDTRIKRAHTLRALQEISAGRCDTVYSKRLLPYVHDFLTGEFEY